jgi:curved DNA-binding protein CbpA
MVKEAEENAEADKAKKELVEAKNQAESLVHATEKSLEEHGDKVDPDHGRGDRTGRRRLKDELETEDAGKIKGGIQNVTEAAMKLGEAIYKAQQEEADGDAGRRGRGCARRPGRRRSSMPISRISTTTSARKSHHCLAGRGDHLAGQRVSERRCRTWPNVTYYEVLGSTERAHPADEIKKAYRKKAKELHPDRNADNPNAEAQFKEANEAYDVLKDADKKAAYDRFGHAAFDGGMAGRRARGGFGGAQGQGDFASAFSDVFDDLFGDFMGGQQRGGGAPTRQPRLGPALQPARQSRRRLFGSAEARSTCPPPSPAAPARAPAPKAGRNPSPAPPVPAWARSARSRAFSRSNAPAPPVPASARSSRTRARPAAAQGRVQKDRALNVNIPAGVETGTRIRLSGEGEAGLRGGPRAISTSSSR